ncbi:hypothetical protein MMC11_001471 [Xylographa trunciseda]|nr:hypothetical protein [Xylographa trunciseda]
MPNPGHRSRGCHACRKMKTKCDELHPSCGRCTRAGRVCPGYRDESDPFRSMNPVSEKKVRGRKPSKRKSSGTARARLAQTTASSLIPRSSYFAKCNAIVPALSTDWAGQSIPFFFAGWVAPPDILRSNRVVFNYFPAMYAASSSVCLTEAIKAAALAYMANTASIEHLDKMAQESYGRALAAAMSAMSCTETATSDETLSAILALAVYEVISGRQCRTDHFALHREGLSTILKMRGQAQFRTPLGRVLFASINKILLWKDLQDRRRPTLAITDWPDGLHNDPAMDFSARLAVRVADVSGRTREAAEVAYADRDMKWLQSLGVLIQDTLDLDQEVQHHINNPPEDWRWWSLPVPLANNSASSSSSGASESDDSDDGQHSQPSYPSRMDIYPTATIGSHWNTVRGTRLPIFRAFRILSLLVRQHPFVTFPSLPSSVDVYTALNTTVTDICASIPFLMGDVDASGARSNTIGRPRGEHVIVLLWLLHMLCGIDGLEPGLKAWILKVLERMGTAGGVRQGLVLSLVHSEPSVPKPWVLT